jgi:hypothetical protein
MNEVWTLNWYRLRLKLYKINRLRSPGIDQIPLELIKAGFRTICCQIHKLINSIQELPEEWKESVMVLMYRKSYTTGCNNYRSVSLLSTTYRILSNILLSKLIPYAEKLLRVRMDYNALGQLLIIYSSFFKYLRKKMGLHRSSASSICRFQESLWFNYERVFV